MPLTGTKLVIQNVQLKRGRAAAWTKKNPVLLAGEVGLETDTKKFKVGDGTTTWTELAYWGGGAEALDTITVIDGGEIVDDGA